MSENLLDAFSVDLGLQKYTNENTKNEKNKIKIKLQKMNRNEIMTKCEQSKWKEIAAKKTTCSKWK